MDAPATGEEPIEHVGSGLFGLFERVCHDDALAGREAIGLDDDGSALLTDVFERRLEFREVLVSARRDIVAGEEILGEGLGSFQLCGCGRGAEAGQAELIKAVGYAGDERCLRTDDRQCDALVLCELRQCLDVI